MFPEDKRIGVMMGGLSSEREVSLKSGAAVLKALKSSGLNAFALEVNDESFSSIQKLLRDNDIDVVFIVMHGGFGEDGRLQGILQKLKIPFTGPCERASRIAMDKLASRRLFKKAGLSIAPCRRLIKGWPLFLPRAFEYPLVVKPSAQGSSIGITFVGSALQLSDAIRLAFQYGRDILLERFIKGREITVSVLDGKALPVVEIIPKTQFFDFQAKYEKGLTEYLVPAKLETEVLARVNRDAVIAYKALGCRHLSRVDMIIAEDNTPYVLEVNTVPGMTETSLFPKAAKAAGLSFETLCRNLVDLALSDNGKK